MAKKKRANTDTLFVQATELQPKDYLMSIDGDDLDVHGFTVAGNVVKVEADGNFILIDLRTADGAMGYTMCRYYSMVTVRRAVKPARRDGITTDRAYQRARAAALAGVR